MNRNWLSIVLVAAVMSCMLSFYAFGQTGSGRSASDKRTTPKADPEIPAAALLTAEGRDLAAQLQQLRRSLSALGSSHPSIGPVRAEIEAVKRRLATFSTNPFTNGDAGDGTKKPVVQEMTAEQLRELVLQMATKMEQLERRIFVLERRLGNMER